MDEQQPKRTFTEEIELAGSQLHMAVNDVTFGVGWQF